MTINHRVSLRFSRLSSPQLAGFADVVINGLTGNPAFPNLPVPLAMLADLLAAFRDTLQSAMDGGKRFTAAKNAARVNLLTALRKEAAYVQSVASQDLTTLLSSGFRAADTNRASTPLDAPAILRVLNSGNTRLLLRVTPRDNARGYQVRLRNGSVEWQDMGVFTKARRIELAGLTPGTVYELQSRAIGGSTGSSGWSDPVSHMAA